MKRTLLSFVSLSAAVVLAGCNGSISSVGIPADSPWNTFSTIVTSPHDDLTVVTVGSDVSASISLITQIAVCTSDQGRFFAVCADVECVSPDPAAACVDQASPDATNVGFDGQLPFVYAVDVTLDRPDFAAGGVQIESATAGTLGAIALTLDAGATLNIGAGFSEGLIQGPTFESNVSSFPIPTELMDDFTGLDLGPDWLAFGEGHVCTDGTTTSCDPAVSFENVAAFCTDSDEIGLRTNEATGPVSVLCGDVTINLNINAPFESVGECLGSLKQQECSGLTGQAKAACNHAQIGICNATFNVPSAHNPN
jgi:hypothetical protein